LLAFAAVYLIWGSTYLAIRYAVETIPPFFMAGCRFVVAGATLYLWTRASGAAPPCRRDWASATIIAGVALIIHRPLEPEVRKSKLENRNCRRVKLENGNLKLDIDY
jgi:hypothetical protein